MGTYASMVTMAKRLLDKFPDDVVLCEEDVDLLEKEPSFAQEVATTLSDFKVVEDATAEGVMRWSKHAGTYKAKLAEGAPPSRYWALVPLDNTYEFRSSKHFVLSIALIEDGRPVLGLIGCPLLSFDHVDRSRPHPNGCPIFFAVDGLGSWTQLVIMNRPEGEYTGEYMLKAKPMRLNVTKKIHRTNDCLYDVLGTDQLRVAMDARLREDVVVDAERIAKILGSDYPKMNLTTCAIKYCWLARGEADIIWYFPGGLYDTNATERLVDHAAGTIICKEGGAEVSDLDGKPIEWPGNILEKNRGLVVCDPNRIAIQGVLRAVSEASEVSTTAFNDRVQKRKEMSKFLFSLVNTMDELAETDEEKAGMAKVLERSKTAFKDEAELDEIVLQSMHRTEPILGEGPTNDVPFETDNPFATQISTD